MLTANTVPLELGHHQCEAYNRQIRKIAGCECAGNAGNVIPVSDFKASDPGMNHGTCVTHVPWCMSVSLTRGDGENVPSISGACTTHNFTYLVRGPYTVNLVYAFSFLSMVLPKQCKKDVPWTTCLQCTCLQSLYIPHTVTGTRCFIITSKHNGHVFAAFEKHDLNVGRYGYHLPCQKVGSLW